MKKLFLTSLFLICSCDQESEPVDPTLDIEGDVEFRAGPVFDDSNETIDMCCPHTSNGKSWDVRCGHDVNNTCPSSSGYTTGWSLNGSTVDFWTLVSCYTCGVQSSNCSNTRWIDNGVYGFECGGTAIRKLFNSVVDDDCGNNSCSWRYIFYSQNGKGTPGFADPSGMNYDFTDITTTWKHEASVMAMCCRLISGFNFPSYYQCIMPDYDSNNEPRCLTAENPAYDDAGFTQSAWCHPCDGFSSSHGEYGSWDLQADKEPEWSYSLLSVDLDQDFDDETWTTAYTCGGYLISYNGSTVLSDNCN